MKSLTVMTSDIITFQMPAVSVVGKAQGSQPTNLEMTRLWQTI